MVTLGPNLLSNQKWRSFITNKYKNFDDQIDAFNNINIDKITDFIITNRDQISNTNFVIDVNIITKDLIGRAKQAYDLLKNVFKPNSSYLICLKILLNIPTSISLSTLEDKITLTIYYLSYSVLNGHAIEQVKHLGYVIKSIPSYVLYDLNYVTDANKLSLYLTNQTYKVYGFNYSSLFDDIIDNLRWNRDVVVDNPELMLKLIDFKGQYQNMLVKPDTIFSYNLLQNYVNQYRISVYKFIIEDMESDILINKRYQAMF